MLSVRAAARRLLEELQSSYPETCKVPNGNGGYVRVPVSVNTEWYRRFCRQYLSVRRRYPKPRTLIRRCHTIKALERIAQGNLRGVYAERLGPFVEEARRVPKRTYHCCHQDPEMVPF